MEATNANVRGEPLEILTYPAVLEILPRLSVSRMMIVRVNLLARPLNVLTPVLPCPVETMLPVYLKTMQPGAVASLDSRKMMMASVLQCAMIWFVV